LQAAGAENKETAQRLQEFNDSHAQSHLSQRLQSAADGIRSIPGQLSNPTAQNSSQLAALLPRLAGQISEFSQRLQGLSASSTTSNPSSSTPPTQSSGQSTADTTKLAALSQEIIQQSQNLAQRVNQFTENISSGSS
jgi:methyl-accepting chemotaxis protein